MEKMRSKPKRSCCGKCFIGCLAYVLALILLLFIATFVIVPVVFKYSTGIQRNIIFPNWIATYEPNAVEESELKGVNNFYVTVNEKDNITLGVWQILPEEVLKDNKNNDYDYDDFLVNGTHNIVLYLHGNGGVRSIPIETYQLLRQQFQVFACDYRSYADSTKADLTETGIVDDVTALYKWLRKRTKARIFIWGHSLGTGIGTHTISNLKTENITPSGLVLESPFTRITDVMERHFMLKWFYWLPWFRATFLDPIDDHDFGFHSDEYIVNVDCPIMILHAKDDGIIPYDLATKLYEIALEQRNSTHQGQVIYHLFEARGYDHMMLFEAPELPKFTRDFVQDCIDFEEMNKNNETAS